MAIGRPGQPSQAKRHILLQLGTLEIFQNDGRAAVNDPTADPITRQDERHGNGMLSLVNLSIVKTFKDAMIDAGCIEGLRILYRVGCSFGLHSVNEKVGKHEANFGLWRIDGNCHHRNFKVTHKGLCDVDRILPTLTVEDFKRSDWEMAAFIKENTCGLAYAKASFA